MATKKIQTAKLPSNIQVAGFDVSVRPMIGQEKEWSSAGGVYSWGAINVDLDSTPQRVAMCLVHELLHACFEHSGLRYKYSYVDGQDVEEEIVSSLGFTLTQILATQDDFVNFVRDAFQGKPIEIPAEALQIPIPGSWGTSVQDAPAPQTKKRKPYVLKK